MLVIDIGSTRLKAGIYSGTGAQICAYSTSSSLHSSKVAPKDVLEAVIGAADNLCAGLRPKAIAVTSATRSHVLTAKNGDALGDVIKLDNTRGALFEEEIHLAYQKPEARGMGAFHPLARLLDCMVTQPELYAAAQWQLELKDWINLKLSALSIFLLCFIGLGISVFPHVIPGSVTIWEAATDRSSQVFMLVGTTVVMPMILGDTVWSYYVFRGKVQADGYHS